MNRRGFVGAALAGLGGLFFPQKESFAEIECSDGSRWKIRLEEITGLTESRFGIKDYHRNKGSFLVKASNVDNGQIIEAYPFDDRESAMSAIRSSCNSARDFDPRQQ